VNTTSTLTEFNEFSTKIYNQIYKEFETHTKIVIEMKKDLENVFKRIRVLKQNLQKSEKK
jgi:hypothetical protein